MPTSRASALASATCFLIRSPPPAASSDTLLGELKQWSKACTRSLTRLPLCCQARSNPSPYSSRGSTLRTLRHSRSTFSTLTRRAPPSRQAVCTERTSPLSAFDLARCSRSSMPCSLARVLRASSSGATGSLERGSARHSGAQRSSPVAGSRPWNIARTCSALAIPSRPLAWVAVPTKRPGGLAAAGEVLFAVAGDLVQPVGLLARLHRLDWQCHPARPPGRHQAAAVHRRCGCVDAWNCGEDSTKESGICR
jgi:hypothetical protein